MAAAVERTLAAIQSGEQICVYGDYDVDGVCSTALLTGTLRLLGVRPMVVIPHRLNDGYGMHPGRMDEIAAAGVKLIITVDNGITAVESIRRAGELGIDVVVTDHHLAGEEMPQAAALVNPNRGDDPYEHPLCGTGVAFKFAHALLKKSGRPESESKAFLMQQLDLVGLGTLADMVPLHGENRILARHGLDAIANTRREGLRALMEKARIDPRRLTSESVAFGIAPRLNAAGRTDDAMRALELLLTTDPKEARRLAEQLDFLNRERQKIEREIFDASIEEVEAAKASDGHALVVGGEGWHLGVVGIVASRLTERFELPAIVLGIEDKIAKGSARSVPGFDIHEALCACSGHLVTYGGHAAAAGLQLKVAALEDFRAALNEHAATTFAGMDVTQEVCIDAELEGAEFDWKFYHSLQRLQPFGQGNPAPTFMMRGVQCAAPPRIVGRGHLRLRLSNGPVMFNAIGFSQGSLKSVFENGPADILFRPRENTYNGTTSLEMELCGARPSEN